MHKIYRFSRVHGHMTSGPDVVFLTFTKIDKGQLLLRIMNQRILHIWVHKVGNKNTITHSHTLLLLDLAPAVRGAGSRQTVQQITKTKPSAPAPSYPVDRLLQRAFYMAHFVQPARSLSSNRAAESSKAAAASQTTFLAIISPCEKAKAGPMTSRKTGYCFRLSTPS